MEKYIGFYPSRPIWVGSEIDFSQPMTPETFTSQMSEFVYQEDTDELSIRVCRDGQILFRIYSLEKNQNEIEPSQYGASTMQTWGAYLNYLNSFYLLLDAATIQEQRRIIFDLQEITTKDVIQVKYENGKLAGGPIAQQSLSSIYQMARYVHTYNRDIPIESDDRIFFRQLVSLKSVTHASKSFINVFSKPGSEKHLSSYAKSLAEYKIGNNETAVVLSWFIIESIINSIWSTHLESLNKGFDNGKRRINSERRKDLKGANYTANIKTNMLELFGLLDFELFEAIDRVRVYRNKVAHTSDYSPSESETQEALSSAREMIIKKWEIDFAKNLSFSFSGII